MPLLSDPPKGKTPLGIIITTLSVLSVDRRHASPSSAACERVFALLKRLFTEEQRRTLGDAIEAALMLRYNRRYVG